MCLVYMYVYMYASIYACACMYVYICMHVYICIMYVVPVGSSLELPRCILLHVVRGN